MNNAEDIRNLVVEVLNNRGSEKEPDWLLGSGAFVSKNLVLTAFHNVQCTSGLYVRCILHGTELFPVRVLLQGNMNIDLALLEVSNMEVDALPLHLGEVDQSVSALVGRCWAIGFPRFKQRIFENEPLRDSTQVDGKIPTGDYLKSASLKQSLLTLRVESTPQPLPTIGEKIHKSEWAGMSGATVFLGTKISNSIILGVITEHHPREGSNSLTIVPITAIDLLSEAEAAKWWQLLGVDRRAFMRLPGGTSLATVGLSNLVVEVIHNWGDDNNPNWSVGSGFFVGKNLVLTASHNVGGSGELLVRLHGIEEHSARVLVQGDDTVDLAILEVPDVAVGVPLLRYGVIDRSVPAVVKPCWAVGFPRFKERQHHPKPRRLSAQVSGEILTGENLDQPLLTLHMRSSPRPLSTMGMSSAWSGMAGAAVFSGENIIVGVITEHHLPEGEAALTVMSITALDLLPQAEAAKWWTLLGVNRQALARLPD
jgi:Trypsin-like peptidase domain